MEPNLDFPKQDYEQQFFMLKVFVIGGIGTVLGTLVRSFSALEDMFAKACNTDPIGYGDIG